MGVIKQIATKNPTYYFYNDIMDIKCFELKLLKLTKKSYKDIGIYSTRYITIKRIDDCKSIHSVNPLLKNI